MKMKVKRKVAKYIDDHSLLIHKSFYTITHMFFARVYNTANFDNFGRMSIGIFSLTGRGENTPMFFRNVTLRYFCIYM